MIQVADQHVVSLRFAMRDASGQLLEENLNGPAISYLQGGRQILRELQLQLEGMMAGEHRKVALLMPEAPPRRFMFDVYVDGVRAATQQEINIGYPLIQQERCGPDCDC